MAKSRSWKGKAPITDLNVHAQVASYGNSETPAVAKPRTRKGKGRRGDTSKQATGPKSQEPTTDLNAHTHVASHDNAETSTMVKPHTGKAKNQRSDTPTEPTGSKPLQPTAHLINHTRVTGHGNSEMSAMTKPPTRKARGSRWQTTGSKSQQRTPDSINRTEVTNHNNLKTPAQSGSSEIDGNAGQGDSIQPEHAGNIWKSIAVTWDQGNNWQKTTVDTQTGTFYPLPGTIVDFSRPKSDFLPECQLPRKQQHATYKSLLDLTKTAFRPNLPDPRLFSYNREWVSLGDRNPRDVYDMVHRRDALQQLPRIHRETSEADVLLIQKLYHRKRKDAAFSLMQATTQCEPRLLLAPAPAYGVLNTSEPIKTDHGNNPKNMETGLIRLMNIPELFNKVVHYIEPFIADLTSLAMACKDTARLTSSQFAVWDFSSGNFHTEETYGNGVGGIRMNTLIITPITKVHASTPEDKPFEREFKLLTKMVRIMCSTLTSFRHLILDQIPYLTIDLVMLMIKSMPNLESIAITRCKQLDFSQLGPLLRVMWSMKKLADTGHHKQVRLDFYPYFFEGPTFAPNTLGSFGLTYHKPTFDVPKAIFARIMAYWDTAGKLGVDLLSDSSGIWHFIRRLPGPDPFWAYKAREAVLTWERDRCIPLYGHDAHLRRSEVTRRLWNDLAAAVSGDTTERISHQLKERKCSGCTTPLPDYLFADTKYLVCWGCRMGAFVVNHEDSHFRDRTNRVVEIWLGNRKQWAKQRLYRLPRDEVEEGDALNMARLTDKAWRYELFEFKPSMSRYPQAIHYTTHLSSTKRTRDLLWPLTGPTNNREGGPQYHNPYLQSAVLGLSDEKANHKVRDLDKTNRRDFFGIYSHDVRRLPDWEPYNRNWEARERAKAVWQEKAAAYYSKTW
ncbi:unnamed protein product [Sordaria macrospora k-hell]|uniref:WGS project CABT00000000 data, contig 2.1 n=1 Tax=Sordaria macrospora (strain ATCC MYA-333 / DSM 997 / K(L3346) / K-hell) TaxID=771870 RepID=F7VKG7_SORMK|nr:uncharacterized protein SMAC_00210 [Sordaria macrospora k-hell]CCC05994.1 unnamed protein product [Sordaria macrospora k-hell]